MPIQIITPEDLEQFRASIIAEMKAMLGNQELTEEKTIKSAAVRKILKISNGTLQNYRNNKVIAAKKVGGNYLYLYEDVISKLPQKRK